MQFNHQFILDRDYYCEVYDQTANKPHGWQAFRKAIILVVLGLVASSFASTAKYIHLSYFVIGLGCVEALAVRFAKTWWLWRQLISKAANNPVNITIDENGILVKSAYLNQEIQWQDISHAIENEKGFIFESQEARHYLSKNGLKDDALQFVQLRCKAFNEPSKGL